MRDFFFLPRVAGLPGMRQYPATGVRKNRNNAMRILLIDLASDDGAAAKAIATTLAGKAEIEISRPAGNGSGQHGDNAGFDLLLLCGDDAAALQGACRSLAANAAAPLLVLGPCDRVETAIALMKAGAADILVRDADGGWQERLPDAVSATARRPPPKPPRNRQGRCEEGGRLERIVDGSSVPTFVIDSRHRVTHWNRACTRLTGIPAAKIVGTGEHWQAFYTEPRPCLADLIVDGTAASDIGRYYAGKGHRPSPVLSGAWEAEDFFPGFGEGGRWLFFTAAPLHDSRGAIVGAIETLVDVTERRHAEALMQESEQRLRQIVDGSAVAAFVIDRSHRITHWNRACAALTGVPAESVLGTREQWRAFYPAERPCLADLVVDGADDQFKRFYGSKKIHRSSIVEDGFEAEDFFAAFGDGGRWLYFTAAPLRNARGEIVGAVETMQDITEKKRAEEELRRSEERYRLLSITDGMTGLFNARHFAQRLTEEMDRSQRYRHPLSLMMMDVDNFKRFNDTWGHVEGDQVLIRLAECITACLRRTDQAFRYGGEEFVVLLPETRMDEAIAAAERVRAMFGESRFLPEGADAEVSCTASIGVTLFIPGESPRDFVARADSGTYEAKRQGKNRVIRILPRSGDLPD